LTGAAARAVNYPRAAVEVGVRYFVFDAYGTLFDVHSAASRYRNEIGDKWPSLSQLWRSICSSLPYAGSSKQVR